MPNMMYIYIGKVDQNGIFKGCIPVYLVKWYNIPVYWYTMVYAKHCFAPREPQTYPIEVKVV